MGIPARTSGIFHGSAGCRIVDDRRLVRLAIERNLVLVDDGYDKLLRLRALRLLDPVIYPEFDVARDAAWTRYNLSRYRANPQETAAQRNPGADEEVPGEIPFADLGLSQLRTLHFTDRAISPQTVLIENHFDILAAINGSDSYGNSLGYREMLRWVPPTTGLLHRRTTKRLNFRHCPAARSFQTERF